MAAIVDVLVSATVDVTDAEAGLELLEDVVAFEYPDRYRNEVSNVRTVSLDHLDSANFVRSDEVVLPEGDLTAYDPNTVAASFDRGHVLLAVHADSTERLRELTGVLTDLLDLVEGRPGRYRMRYRLAVDRPVDPEGVAGTDPGFDHPGVHPSVAVENPADGGSILTVDCLVETDAETLESLATAVLDDVREWAAGVE